MATRKALVEALRREPHPLFVVGTGVSIGAVGGPKTAPTVTWTGLIKHGLTYAKAYSHKSDGWLQGNRTLLENATDVDDLSERS